MKDAAEWFSTRWGGGGGRGVMIPKQSSLAEWSLRAGEGLTLRDLGALLKY